MLVFVESIKAWINYEPHTPSVHENMQFEFCPQKNAIFTLSRLMWQFHMVWIK
jgi:hypothetical protein